MSDPTKARGRVGGQAEAALGRLKARWLRLSDEERVSWREALGSSNVSAEKQEEFRARFRIQLPADAALDHFRQWLAGQEERDRKAAQLHEDEARVRTEHPRWTLEQVRDAVLKHSFYHSLAQGDFQLGLKAVAQEVNVRRLSLDAAKLVELRKVEQAKALEFCLAEARAFPNVRNLFQQAFAALKDASFGAPRS